MKTIFTAFFLFLSILIQAQTTYYIDPAGNNGNNGSISSPWLTLTYACAHAIKSGDIIHVNAGTYNETVQSVLAVGVSIEGVGNTSIIKSTLAGTGPWGKTYYTIRLESSSQNNNSNQHISGIKMDGNSYTAFGGITVSYRGGVEIYNCSFVNFKYWGVRFIMPEPPVTYATNNKFHDNIVTNCGGFYESTSEAGLGIGGQDGMLIYNNTITQNRGINDGDCIMAVEGFIKNVKIYNNTLSKTLIVGITSWDFAIEFWNCQGGVEIYDNIITGSIDIVKSPDKGKSDYVCWIHDNIIGQPVLLAKQGVRGVLLEFNCSDIIIERNYIHSVAAGIFSQQGQTLPSTQSNIKISYNIFDNIGSLVNSTGWGVYFSVEERNDIAKNINVWNNVFIAATNAYSTRYGIGLPDVGTATNVSVKNNIVVGFDDSPVFASGSGGTKIDYLSVENNIFFGNGNSNLPHYTGGMAPTNNITQNNIISDPLFVSKSTSDFHLQSGSPAINHGIQIASLITDYDSVTVSNPPEIGAYEYFSTVPTVTFTVASQSKAENGGTATITAQLSETTDVDVTIPFTVTGTAMNPADYTVTSSPITILAGSTTGTVTVTIVNDAVREADETVILTMGTPTNATMGATTVHTLTITNDDQTTYYIDPAGNNSNTGTIGSPWLTLAYACAHAITTGDIIHVNAGTYNETVQSVLREGVSIEGEGKTSIIYSKVTANDTFTILMSSLAEGTKGDQSISYIRMEGGLTAYGAIYVAARSNVLIHHCEFEDFLVEGVIFSGQLRNKDGEPKTYATGNKFYDNIVTNCADYRGTGKFGDGKGNLGIGGQQGLLVYNNTMVQKDRGKDANGYVIKFENDGFIKGVKIYNNTIIKPPYDNSTWDFAIELWHYRGGVEIYNNNIQGSIDIGGNAYGGTSVSCNDAGGYGFAIKIYNNTIGQATMRTCEETGINPERGITGGVYIYNNWFNNLSTPLQMYQGNGDTFEDLWVYNNVFTNIGIVGREPGNTTDWGTIDGNTITYDDIYFLNNTVYAGAEGVAANSGLRFDFPGSCTDLYVRNNIIEGFDVFAIYFGGSPVTGVSVENNIYYKNASNTANSGGTIITGKTEKNNIIGNPQFVSDSDFHLQGTSPAIGAGINVGLTADKDGVMWKNPPSIGAYEYPYNIENHPPSIQDQGFQMNENSPNGTSVGIVVASDPDAGQTLTYSIVSGNTNGAFAINALTGVLSVANSTALTVDFSLVVKVQDKGFGELSSQAAIVINIIPTGFELTGNNGAIKVYPNPVTDELIIEFKGNNERLSFNILNSIGQIVFNGNLAERTIVQTGNFSSGVYLMKIENGRSFEFKKIVKV